MTMARRYSPGASMRRRLAARVPAPAPALIHLLEENSSAVHPSFMYFSSLIDRMAHRVATAARVHPAATFDIAFPIPLHIRLPCQRTVPVHTGSAPASSPVVYWLCLCRGVLAEFRSEPPMTMMRSPKAIAFPPTAYRRRWWWICRTWARPIEWTGRRTLPSVNRPRLPDFLRGRGKSAPSSACMTFLRRFKCWNRRGHEVQLTSRSAL